MDLGQSITALPIFLVNGFLATVYWFAANFTDAISILVAAMILFWIDPYIQNRATARARRYGRGAAHAGAPTSQYLTLFTILTWVLISQFSSQPIPFIGMCLWLIGLIGILAVSEQRFNQLWWAKIGIITYAAIVVILRIWIGAIGLANPADWASIAGSSADAQVMIQNTRSNVVTISILFEWFIFPLGYTGLLLNKALRNPKPLFNVFTEPGEVLRRLRVRA